MFLNDVPETPLTFDHLSQRYEIWVTRNREHSDFQLHIRYHPLRLDISLTGDEAKKFFLGLPDSESFNLSSQSGSVQLSNYELQYECNISRSILKFFAV